MEMLSLMPYVDENLIVIGNIIAKHIRETNFMAENPKSRGKTVLLKYINVSFASFEGKSV